MYSKIFIPLDGSTLSERAVDSAKSIARGTDCELFLVQVACSPLEKAPAEAGPAEDKRAALEAFDAARSYLENVTSRLSQDECRARSQVLEGDPASAIVAFADRENVDVIVMSTHGRSGLSKMIMGSVAERVARETDRSVMLIKPGRAGKGARRAA